MTLVRLSGAPSLREPFVCQILGECVASSPLGKTCWVMAKEVGYTCLIHTTQVAAVKQCASFLFPAAKFMALLVDLNVTKTGFRHFSEVNDPVRGQLYRHYGPYLQRAIPRRQAFSDR